MTNTSSETQTSTKVENTNCRQVDMYTQIISTTNTQTGMHIH